MKIRNLVVSVILFVAIGFFTPLVLTAQSNTQTITSLENSITALNNQYNADSLQLKQLENQKQGYSNSLNQVNQIFASEDNSLNAIQTLLSSLNAKLIVDKGKLSTYIKNRNLAYKMFYENTQINPVYLVFSTLNFSSFVVQWGSNQAEISNFKQQISIVNSKISEINKGVAFEKSQGAKVSQELALVNSQRNQIYGQLYSLNNNINGNIGNLNSLKSQIAQVQTEINNLNALIAQKASQNQGSVAPPEVNNTSQACSNNSQCQFKFYSNGLGNYFGASQYGMYGMAQAGKTYQDIAAFYYPGTSIQTFNKVDNQDITINGQSMTLGQYLAGLDEVPSNWPQQSVDAQILMARTYVLYHCGITFSNCALSNGQGFQVYSGGNAKASEVSDTANQAIVYNGSPIYAAFSSSNGGYVASYSSAICALGWSNCGSSIPYLQSSADPYDTLSNDPNYQYVNPSMTSIQLVNIINTARAVCLSLNNNCNFLQVGQDIGSPQQSTICGITVSLMPYTGNSQLASAINTDMQNTCSNNGTNDTFSNINNYLTSNGVTPIQDITGFSINPIGKAQLASTITVNSSQGTFTFNAGAFFWAFNMVAPNYNNWGDALMGVRFYVTY